MRAECKPPENGLGWMFGKHTVSFTTYRGCRNKQTCPLQPRLPVSKERLNRALHAAPRNSDGPLEDDNIRPRISDGPPENGHIRLAFLNWPSEAVEASGDWEQPPYPGPRSFEHVWELIMED
jgi:hypothetical protein